MIKRFCFLFLYFSLLINLQSIAQNYKFKTLVIDAGHGGKDPGCHGKFTKEKDIALNVSLELGRIVKENMKDVKVIYTRKDDNFIPLYKRAEIANKNQSDFFISIHCNASPSPKAYGTETYAMGLHVSDGNLKVATRENSAILEEDNYLDNYEGFDPTSPEGNIIFQLFQNAFLDNSLKLASGIQNEFSNKVNRKNRGVKQAGFVVLWRTSGPSVLVEIGYLTNPKEELFLSKKTNQVYIASAIYRALKQYKKDLESLGSN